MPARPFRLLALALLLAAGVAAAAPPDEEGRIAEAYVKLVLALGQHDADYVDAYYGPPAWQKEAAARKRPVAALRAEARALGAALAKLSPPRDDLGRARRRFLAAQLASAATRADLLAGTRMRFDDESRALFGVVLPRHTDQDFEKALRELDKLLPGKGPLGERYDAWRKRYEVPAARLEAVMRAATAECRKRTVAYLKLPAGEKFTLEIVKGKPWGAYNWYRGGLTSLIQVNTDVQPQVRAAVNGMCHEGYPGHHVYNALLEQELVKKRGWIEYSVYPLHSPQSLVAEGLAEYSYEIAFSRRERLEYEKRVLYPLAGLDPATAERWDRIWHLIEELRDVTAVAARRYLDGEVGREATVQWLMRHSPEPRRLAERDMKFIEKYRTYVINYPVGYRLVKAYVESRGGASAAKRWEVYGKLMMVPVLPEDLAPAAR